MSPNLTLRPELMIYVDEVDGRPQVCLETETRKPPLVATDPVLVWAIQVLPDEFDEHRAKAIWSREPAARDRVDQIWSQLLDNDLLRPAGPRPTHLGYHAATRAHPFLNMSAGYQAFAADNNLMSSYRKDQSAPSVYLDLDYVDIVDLQRATDLSDPYLRVDLSQHLSLLFDGTFGERAKLPPFTDDLWDYSQDELLLKAIPSGGARHPTEAFALIRYPGVPSGLYHYNVRRNALGRLGDYPDAAALAALGPGVRDHARAVGTTASIVVILVSYVERAMFRYRDPRSFRAIVVDTGHAIGQLAELGEYLGLEYRHVPDFDPDAISKLLPLDLWQAPVTACGVLSR
jgi:SagB-type dehydrogenase family enzyme